MSAAASDEQVPKVFIIKTPYGYAASPSPVVVPGIGANIIFRNLSGDEAKVTILKEEATIPDGKTIAVRVPESDDKVIFYSIRVGERGLFARGNSSPIIIRDP